MREGRREGGRERKTRNGDEGRRKENGRRGGQTGPVKGSFVPVRLKILEARLLG